MKQIRNLKKFLILPIALITIMFFLTFAFVGCLNVREGQWIKDYEVIVVDSNNEKLKEWIEKKNIKNNLANKLLTNKNEKFNNLIEDKLSKSDLKKFKRDVKELEISFFSPSTTPTDFLLKENKDGKEIVLTFDRILIKMICPSQDKNVKSSSNHKEEVATKTVEIDVESKTFKFEINSKKEISGIKPYDLKFKTVTLI